MADVFELIPEEKRPYRWAYQEMMMILQRSKDPGKPNRIRLLLDSLVWRTAAGMPMNVSSR